MRGCRLNTLQDTGQAQRRHKGQTLAEFAITLPILLILLFGIIEFGRIFQAWVTLQNSARAAVRYASTGQYFEDKFPMKTDMFVTLDTAASLGTGNDPNSVIPCVDDKPPVVPPAASWTSTLDQRGNQTTLDGVKAYTGGLESIFATWYGGLNCDPRNPDHDELRKDMMRLLSIFEEARKGAGGLALEQNSWALPADKTNITGFPLFEVWKVPNPRETGKGWFNVVVCSTRSGTRNNATLMDNYYGRVDATGATPVDSVFVTYLGDQTLRVVKPGDPNFGRDLSSSPSSNPRLPQAGCMLNELDPSRIPSVSPAPANGFLDNLGKPWLDAGGPSDTVTVIVTFNHPLVTPLGLAPYIKMQARRSAIVEAFRTSSLQQAFDPAPGLEIQPPTLTLPPTNTPTQTFTPTATGSTTPVPTATPTNTQTLPFSCTRITATPVFNGTSPGVFGNTISIDIKNDNSQATFLTRVIFKWPTILDYPNMFVSEMALNGAPHWQGMDKSDLGSATNTTDTNTDGSIPPNFFVNTQESDRTISGSDTGNWTGLLGNGPTLLQQYVSINNFGGTTFYLFNPLTPGTPCVIPLTLTPPTNTPVGLPNRTNTPTFTPDCASNQVSVRWIGFEQFGIVRLEVVNNRNVVSPMTDFTIMWNQRLPGILTLDRVTTVAPFGQPGSIEIWRASSATQDSTPPTGGHTEGTWVQNYTFPPNSITALLIDFGGVSGLLSAGSVGMTPSDFNGTQFRIGCGGAGGSGGAGGTNSGLINLSEAPTPAPTNTPGPSNTPRPTLPPTKTFTPGPPTATRTVGPSPTPRPTNTPKPPPTATTPPPPPTLPGGGCIDGCG
jgi:hypothetical protein